MCGLRVRRKHLMIMMVVVGINVFWCLWTKEKLLKNTNNSKLWRRRDLQNENDGRRALAGAAAASAALQPCWCRPSPTHPLRRPRVLVGRYRRPSSVSHFPSGCRLDSHTCLSARPLKNQTTWAHQPVASAILMATTTTPQANGGSRSS